MVAAAITVLAVATILAAAGATVFLMARFFGSLVCDPYFELLRVRLRLPRVAALLALFLTALVPIGLFLWFFGAVLVEQITALVRSAPEWWEGALEDVQSRWPVVREFLEGPEGEKARTALSEHVGTLLQGARGVMSGALTAGAGFMSALGALAGWAVAPVYFAFFLLVPSFRIQRIEGLLPFLRKDRRDDLVFLLEEFVNIIVVFFRGQLVIAFLQGVLYAIGFTVIGLKFGFVLGLALGMLNIIPYLGAMVGFVVTLPLADLQEGGGVTLMVGVLVVIAVVQTIEGYVLTPKIMGDRTGLHPMVIIIAMFFWGTAFGGILGMILAIPLTAFAVVFWRLAKEKYIQEWV